MRLSFAGSGNLRLIEIDFGGDDELRGSQALHIADTFKSNIKSPLDDILEEDGL